MMMRCSVLLLAALALSFSKSEARTWLDVVDPAVYASSILDKNRIQFSLEVDPLDYSTSSPTVAATESPTLAPAESSAAPSAVKDDVPSLAPSIAPTERWEFVSGNGGCPDGEHLYIIRMHDSWGDGWDNTTLKITTTETANVAQETGVVHETNTTQGENTTVTISEVIDLYEDTDTEDESEKKDETVFEGGLEKGSDGYSYACLKSSNCYSLSVDDGRWLNEIKWEVRAVSLGISREDFESRTGYAAAKGLAPARCQFSIPNEDTGEFVCPFACETESSSPTEGPTNGPTKSPTGSPTAASSATPTIIEAVVAQSNPLSDTPSLTPSDSPSRFPTNSPTLAFGSGVIVPPGN